MKRLKIVICLIMACVLIFIGVLSREKTTIVNNCQIIGETKWYTQSKQSKSFVAKSLDHENNGVFTISITNGELWDSNGYVIIYANGYEDEAQIYINNDENKFIFIPYDNDLSGYEISR